jgi:hypothetical protein
MLAECVSIAAGCRVRHRRQEFLAVQRVPIVFGVIGFDAFIVGLHYFHGFLTRFQQASHIIRKAWIYLKERVNGIVYKDGDFVGSFVLNGYEFHAVNRVRVAI